MLKRTLLSPPAEAVLSIFVTVPHAAGVKLNVVFASVRPDGNVSSTLAEVKPPGLVAGFARVSDRVVVSPGEMAAAPKIFATVGGL